MLIKLYRSFPLVVVSLLFLANIGSVNAESVIIDNIEFNKTIGDDGIEYITSDEIITEIPKELFEERNRIPKNFDKSGDGEVEAQALNKSYWKRTLTGKDAIGQVKLTTSGYTQLGSIAFVSSDTIYIDRGYQTATFTSSIGKADKIIAGYSYKFRGLGININIDSLVPVTASTTYEIAKFKSKPLYNTRLLAFSSLPAKATARTSLGKMLDVTIEASADIYYGSKIYRPSAVVVVPYIYPQGKNS